MVSKTALVVDDSKSARFALRRYLEHHHYKVDAAESADEASAFLLNNKPDVIFLDHVMPGVDGFEALRRFKADPATANIPVVICSSNEGEHFNSEARAKGASAVLQKPPSPDQLGQVLASIDARGASPAAATPSAPPAPPAPLLTPRPTVRNDPAVEAAVQKVLGSLPPRLTAPTLPGLEPATYVAHPAPAAPSPALGATLSGMPPLPPLSPEMAMLRDHLEARIRRSNQELFGQIASLKADVGRLQNSLALYEQKLEQMAIGTRDAAAQEAEIVARRIADQSTEQVAARIADALVRALKPNG